MMEQDSKKSEPKAVGNSIQAPNAQWSFGNGVAPYFDSHVERSVPFYRECHELIAQISDFFVSEGSVVYDLGCSSGSLSIKLAERNAGKKIKIVGIDHEPEMIALAKEKCGSYEAIEIVEEDVTACEFEPADLIVSCYTIQFLKPKFRQLLIDKIYQQLNWGGAFLLFEKVRGPDARFQDMMTALYTEHKLNIGFSEAEVINKTRSLKGVLEPFSTQGNYDLLKRAGFVDCMTVFKHVCFEGILAIK